MNMKTKIATADEVLDMLSDKARLAHLNNMVAIKDRGQWYVGRLDVSAQAEIGLIGTGSRGFILLSNADKVLVLD